MSSITFSCKNCESRIEADMTMIGTMATCPNCQTSLSIPIPQIAQGMVIDDFRVDRLVGVGGMGEVWLATQLSLDRPIALKILSPSLVKDPEFVNRFLQEVKMAGKLLHHNIVTAYHAGNTEGFYYLAIEFVDGDELGTLLEEKGSLEENEALIIIRGIAVALQYAWGNFKIIHRDIKPSNIMLTQEGTPKLMDMGISKSLAEDTQLTMAGVAIGTPLYMSPEQAKHDAGTDFRADIYSLGATLYHMVTGEVPYSGTTAMEILAKHFTDPFPDPQEINPNLSDKCSALLEIMLAKSKEERQDSWDLLIEDIDRVIKGKYPKTARPDADHTLITKSPNIHVTRDHMPTYKAPENKSKMPMIMAGCMIALLSVALIVVASKVNAPDTPLDKKESANKTLKVSRQPTNNPKPTKVDTKLDKRQTREKEWKKLKEQLHRYKDDKEQIYSMLNQLKRFRDRVPRKSKLFLKVNEQISSVESKIRKMEIIPEAKLEEVMIPLREEAKELATEKKFQEAANVFNNYFGKYVNETEQRRSLAAGIYQSKHETQLANEATDRRPSEETDIVLTDKQKALNSLIKETAANLMDKKLSSAIRDFNESPLKDELPEVVKVMNNLGSTTKLLKAYFEQRVGQKVTHIIDRKKVSGELTEVGDNHLIIYEFRQGKKMGLSHKISELSAKGKVSILENQHPVEAALIKATSMSRSNKITMALKVLEELHAPEGYLVDLIDQMKKQLGSKLAANEFISCLKKAGISNPTTDFNKLFSAIGKATFKQSDKNKLHEAMTEYLGEFNSSDFVKQNSDNFHKLKEIIEPLQSKYTELLKITEVANLNKAFTQASKEFKSVMEQARPAGVERARQVAMSRIKKAIERYDIEVRKIKAKLCHRNGKGCPEAWGALLEVVEEAVEKIDNELEERQDWLTQNIKIKIEALKKRREGGVFDPRDKENRGEREKRFKGRKDRFK